MVPPSPTSGNRWVSLLAVVVVDVGGADPLLHQVERRAPRLRPCWRGRYRRRSSGRGASAPRTAAGARRSKARWEYSPAGSPRRAARAKRLSSSSAEKAASTLRMSNSSPPTPMCWIRYWNGIDLGDFERALDLVHHLQPRALHRLGDGDDGVRSGAAPDLVVVHGRVQRVQLQLGIAEPVARVRRSAPCCDSPGAGARRRSPPRECRPAGFCASIAAVSR